MSTWSVFRRHPALIPVWLGTLTSLLGDRLHEIALSVAVWQVTHSPAAVGVAFAASTIPNLVLGPFAGPFVDRIERRRLMIASDLARAILAALIPIALWTHAIVVVFVLVGLMAVGTLLFTPARMAWMPLIVPDEDLGDAYAIFGVADGVAAAIGYPLAAMLVVLLGPAIALAFFLDGISYVASALSMWGVHGRPWAPEPRVPGHLVRTYLGELRTGWRALLSDAVLFDNTAISTVMAFANGALNATVVILAVELAGQSYEAMYGAIASLGGIGFLLGTAAAGPLLARLSPGRAFLAGVALQGLTLALLAVIPGWSLAVPAAVLLITITMFGNALWLPAPPTIFGRRARQEQMGRVVSARQVFTLGALSAGALAAGALAAVLPTSLVLGGIGVAVLMVVAWGALVPAVRLAGTPGTPWADPIQAA